MIRIEKEEKFVNDESKGVTFSIIRSNKRRSDGLVFNSECFRVNISEAEELLELLTRTVGRR